jgi:hypothetical protein
MKICFLAHSHFVNKSFCQKVILSTGHIVNRSFWVRWFNAASHNAASHNAASHNAALI